MAILKFISDYFGKKGVGCSYPLITFWLKKGTGTSDFQLNWPPLKFIRRPLPYEVPLGKK